MKNIKQWIKQKWSERKNYVLTISLIFEGKIKPKIEFKVYKLEK
jgi:hypothetical protein